MNVVSQYQGTFIFRIKPSIKGGVLNPDDEGTMTLIQK
jgi:hypothetical protein